MTLNGVVTSQSNFDIYCHYLLKTSNAAAGRYAADDLRRQALLMPHAKITMVARDIMIGNVPIVPDDVSLEAWVAGEVLKPAREETEWVSFPLLMQDTRMKALKAWPEWNRLDSIYLPQGLEPCVTHSGENYEFNGGMYALCDMRLLPQKSYEYKKD